MLTDDRESHPLVRHLRSIFPLTSEEIDAVAGCPAEIVDAAADRPLARAGEAPERCCLILDGWAATYKTTALGRRELLLLHIPGDIPDLQSLHLAVLDADLVTLTPARVAFLPHRSVLGLCERFPNITNALWKMTLVDGAILREWLTNVGARPAYRRLAHLFCETLTRLEAVGLAREHSCEFPLSQAQIGEALGVTSVHVNRTLQQLRAEGLIALQGKQLRALNWDRLQKVGDFDPAYLHLLNSEGGVDQRADRVSE